MNNYRPWRRRGVALLIVLTTLMLAGVAISLVLRANLTARAESRRAAARLQAEYLAVAGYELASERLRADANYSGETWQVSAEELGARDAATVAIEVAADPSEAAARLVTVVADYPADHAAPDQNRHRLTLSWKSPASPESSSP